MSDLLGFVLKTLRPFFGGMTIEVDRQAKTVTIKRKQEVRVMRYDEVIDEIERIFAGD